jgi:hypothetical protein
MLNNTTVYSYGNEKADSWEVIALGEVRILPHRRSKLALEHF